MTVRPGSARAWALAVRPLTLPLGAAPVIVGTALAGTVGPIHWAAAVAALLASLALQIASNLANDLFDNDRGADSGERLGPVRVTQSGLLTRGQVRGGTLGALGVALALGIFLATVGGPPIVAMGLASMVCAVAYTGGPYPLGYHGLGEAFVFLFFGLIAVGGSAYLAAGRFIPISLAYGAAVGALAVAVLVVNNVRDRAGDARVGKRTLVARFGRRLGEWEYAAAWILAAAVPCVLASLGKASPWTALSLVAVALGVRQLARLRALEGAPLNGVLARTGQLTFLYASILAIGLALGR